MDHKASLAAAWQADPRFLQRELRGWVRKAALVDAVWPELLAEAQLQQERKPDHRLLKPFGQYSVS